MRPASKKTVRVLRIEELETRTLMSAVPSSVAEASALEALANSAGDIVVPIHAQVGSTALELVLGMAEKIESLEQALNTYLNGIPGWHLTGGIDTTPSYSGVVDGSIVVGANGLLKSANVSLSCSADIAGGVEGYYGVSVLHVGVGAAADLSASVNTTASYSVDTNMWSFGGAISLVGSVKGYASAMAWPLRGEIYARGDLSADASIASETGLASATIAMVGSVGATAQMRSLFGGWTTIASASRNLGSWQYTSTFNVGAWLQSEVNDAVAASYAARVNAILALVVQARTPANDGEVPVLQSPKMPTNVQSDLVAFASQVNDCSMPLGIPASSNVKAKLNASLGANTDASSATRLALSVHASAIQQLDVAGMLLDCDYV